MKVLKSKLKFLNCIRHVSLRLIVGLLTLLLFDVTIANAQTTNGSLSGTVTLPIGFVAQDDIDITVSLEVLNENPQTFNLEVVDSSEIVTTINLNENSADFMLEIPDTLPSGFQGHYRILYGCGASLEPDCDTLIDAFASASDFSTPTYGDFAARISLNQFQAIIQPVNLTLVSSNTISVPVTLGEQTATSPIDVEVIMEIPSIDLQVSRIVTIEQGASESSVDLVFPPDDLFEFGRFSLFTECLSGCDNLTTTRVGYFENRNEQGEIIGLIPLLGNVFTPFPGFPNADLPIIFFEPDIINNASLLLVDSVELSGDFILPRPANSAESQLVLEVNIEGFDTNGQRVLRARGDNSEPIVGQDTVDFSLEVPVIDGIEYKVSYRCAFLGFSDLECSDYLIDHLFTTSGPTAFASRQEGLTFEQLQAIDELPVVSGQFSYNIGLLEGVADARIGGFLQVIPVTSDLEFGIGSFGDFDQERFDIDAGESRSLDFSGELETRQVMGVAPLEQPGDRYLVRMSCFQCPNSIATQFLTPSGDSTVFSPEDGLISQAEFDSLATPLILLRSGDDLTGTITLPSNVNASGFPSGSIRLIALDNSQDLEGEFLASSSWFIDANAGDTSVEYSFAYGPQDTGFYRLEFTCSFDCDGIAPITYFTPSGETLDLQSASFAVADIPSEANVGLLEAPNAAMQTIDVRVEIPDSFAADRVYRASVILDEFDDNGNFVSNIFDRTISIFTGSRSTSFSETFESLQSGRYRLTYVCVQDGNSCDGLLFDPVTTNGVDVSTEFPGILIPFDELPSSVTVTLLPEEQGTTISGNVSLPSGSVATNDVQISIFLLLAEDATSQNATGITETITIPSGSTSGEYQVDIPDTNLNDFVDFSIRCESNCEVADGDLSVRFVLQTNGTFLPDPGGFLNGRQPVANLPQVIDFQFPPITLSSVTGSIALPVGVQNNQNVDIQVTYAEFAPNGNAVNIVQEVFTIPSSADSVNYQLDYFTPSPTSEISFTIRCIENCIEVDGGLGTTFRLQENGLDFGTDFSGGLLASNFPSTANFQFPTLDLLPDGFEDDNQPTTASTINISETQAHTIHEPGDVDWVRFDVLEGDTDIVLSALSANAVDDRVQMTLFDQAMTEIESASDVLSAAEQSNPQLSEISIDTLPPGIYFLQIQAQSPATDDLSYTLELSINLPEDEPFCFPIVAQNGAVATICL